MAILLKDLLCQISNAICTANSIMEETALNQYVGQGYQKLECQNGELETYIPLTFNMELRDEQNVHKIHNIPVSALMHNTTMRLEQVDLKLKFNMYEQDGNVMVDCKPHNLLDNSLDEMSLQFKNTISTEGISKITGNQIKII